MTSLSLGQYGEVSVLDFPVKSSPSFNKYNVVTVLLHLCQSMKDAIQIGILVQSVLSIILRKFQVMHGGLFKRDDVKLDELRTIDRNRQPGEEGQ